MAGAESRPLREFGGVFDEVAAEYDAVRPSYPAELVDTAVQAASLDGQSAVLEIGSGTGKLTELLVARGLRVHAVEPGAKLVETARARLGPTDAVHFAIGRFEDADLPEGAYDAIFSGTAFHWIDPAIGWSKTAALLRPGGVLALLMPIDLEDERSTALDLKFLEVVREYAPAIARDWSPPRSHDTVIAGAIERAGNASEVWDWILADGMHRLAVPEAADLFDDVRLTTVVAHGEHTADEVLALLRTTSLYFMVAADRREAFERDNRRAIERCGGTFEFTRATVLMTARRAAADAPA